MSLRRLAAALLVVAAILFLIGVATEDHHDESDHTAESGEAHGESGEEHADEPTEGLESPLLVGAAVVASGLLAAGLWLTNRRDVALVAAVAALGFAVLDAFEASALGWVVAVLHLAAAGCAAVAWRRTGVESIRSYGTG